MKQAICAVLNGFVAVCVAAENVASSTSTAVIGDPGKGSDLPALILNAYANGARDITLRPGIYRIPPTGQCAISLNHWTNVTIHATGVTIVFEELAQRPIRLSRCDNITLEGATLRFAEPSFTQGRIKAIGEDAQGKFLDWQIDAGYPIFDPVKSMLDVVDQRTRLLKTGTGDAGCKGVETLGPGLFRLRQLYGLLGSAAVGDWLFTRRPEGGSSIIQLDGCRHCAMRRLTLQNSGFAAFFETGGEGGHYYVDCRVSPGPKPAGATEEQLVGCGADGFHSVGTRKGPTIERCAWEGLLHDDCIAIHGSLQKVERAEGKRLILEKGNRGGFAMGEPVRISSKDGFFGEFTCTALRTLDHGGGLLELTLDRDSGAPAQAKASNPMCDGAGYKILNCTLGNCRSRGILVKADNGLIEGCTITGCGMSAISIGPEYWWGEADYSQNVKLKENTLRNNVLNGSEAGVIFVHGDGAIGNRNITITSNLFDRNYGQIDIYAEDTDGLRIAGNRFITSPILLPGKARTILDFKSTKNITLQGNVAENTVANDILVNLGQKVEGVIGNDASGITLAAQKKAGDQPTAGTSLSDRILRDERLDKVQAMALRLLNGFSAGSSYGEIWIRDFNTFINGSLRVLSQADVREKLLLFFKIQGQDGNVPDGAIKSDKANVGYQYRYSDLAPGWAAHKNTVETDQESSLIQAVSKYVAATGDRSILAEKIGGLTVLERMEAALNYVRENRWADKYGLVTGATTIDWGDVQPESGWGVAINDKTKWAIDIYDNAMFLKAVNDFIALARNDPPTGTNWRKTAVSLKKNTRKYLWDARAGKYIPHIYLDGSPFAADFNEREILYTGGTACAILAGLNSKKEIVEINRQFLAAAAKEPHATIGITVYPPYPQGTFPNMRPYLYQNAGDWTWFGGRMIQALTANGMAEQAYQEMGPMLDRVLKNNGFFEWYDVKTGEPKGSSNFRGEAGVLFDAIEQLRIWAKTHSIKM